jgi:hypothetical protein
MAYVRGPHYDHRCLFLSGNTQFHNTEPLVIPDCADELISTAKLLGKSVGMFMRIDLYATTRGAVFGEFTPQPHGGKGFTEWADEWLGSLWEGKEGCI